MEMETEATNLPWELIIEIFSRLPVKSLMRFRSVSKPCNALVTEPHFINKHLKQSTQHSTLNLKGVILSPTLKLHKRLVLCPLSSLSHEPIEDAKLVYPMKDRSRYVTLSNSCDGLFCIEIISDEEGLLLCNPSTRQFKKLPNSKIEIPFGFQSEELAGITHVLGFDSLNNDYKVLRVVKFDNLSNTKVEVDMYSLNTNSWRKIDESVQYKWSDPSSKRGGSFPFSCYKFVNGAIHWVGIEKNEVMSAKIISMNFSTENFGEVPLPNDAIIQNPHKGLEINLAVLRGMLCVYCNHAKQFFVLWVMKNYGDQESWEKIFDIPYDIFDTPNNMLRLYHSFVPIYLYENGEILLEECSSKGTAVVTYNKNRFGFKKVVARGIIQIREAHVYVESLISPLGWLKGTCDF